MVASSLPFPERSSTTAVRVVRRPLPPVASRALALQRSALFQGLSLADCQTIVARARERSFLENEILHRQGQTHGEISILEAGCVKLTHLLPNGHEFILSLRTPLDTLDPSAISQAEYRTTAQAMGTGRLLSWSLPTLESFPTYPQLRRNLHALVVRELTELEHRYCQMTTCRVDRRLACTLLSLAERIGIQEAGGVTVRISRQELAQMVGTTLFSVCRLVAKWGELELVAPGRESLVILKPKELLECTAEKDGCNS